MFKGQLTVTVLRTKDSRALRRMKVKNLFVDAGYNHLRQVLAGADAVDHCAYRMQFGTGNQPSSATQARLQTSIIPVKTFTVTYPSDYEVQFEAFLLADEGNGFTVREVGLIANSGDTGVSSTEGSLLVRAAISPLIKSSDYIFHFQWIIRS